MKTSPRMTLWTAAACVGAPLCGGYLAAQDRPLLVEAARLVVAPDTVLENGAMLVREGVVAYLGDEIPAEATRGARRLRIDGWVVPGFVDAHSYLGQADDLAESITAFTPDLDAADAFDPFQPLLEHWARLGVTTVGLAPSSRNALSGHAAVVKTGAVGALVRRGAYLKLALVAESLDQNRFPTSRMGAVDLIRSGFAEAAGDAAADDPALAALGRALNGGTPLVFHARSHAAITQALDLAQELGRAPVLLGADEVRHSIARLAALRGSAVLGPLGPDAPLHRLQLPAQLEQAGVPVVFMAEPTPPRPGRGNAAPPRGLPPGIVIQGPPTPRQPTATSADPATARLSAALAVRHGMSRRAALAGLTRLPAVLCGVADRCGTLRSGHDADFVAWDGDPLDLSSQRLAVYLRGEPLFDSTQETSSQ